MSGGPSSSLAELLPDEAARRREFPVVEHKVYLAHAAVCPLPARVASAMSAYLAQVGRGGQFEYLHANAEAGARQLAAALIDATPEEIAFVSSTSAGLSLVAAGLPWKAGDSVVITEGDFPSNVYPWLRLEKLGVRVKSIRTQGDGVATLDAIAARVDDSTRLVALSSVHYATGARADVDAIGAYLHARGILLCVDAIQSLGAVPISSQHVDFLTADAHKWLLGPQGMGVLFVRAACFDRLDPVLLGWKSIESSRDFVQQKLALARTARRYEPGSLNAIGLIGLHAALSLLHGVGVPAISARLAELRALLVPGLERKGYEVLGPSDAKNRPTSGIVSFRREGTDMEALCKALDQAGIVTSLRHDLAGRACIRVAPHFYTSYAEIERLLAAV
jgi:cysteine desulfurase / selenocysteine lyase